MLLLANRFARAVLKPIKVLGEPQRASQLNAPHATLTEPSTDAQSRSSRNPTHPEVCRNAQANGYPKGRVVQRVRRPTQQNRHGKVQQNAPPKGRMLPYLQHPVAHLHLTLARSYLRPERTNFIILNTEFAPKLLDFLLL
jgi:hypothetical protein